MQCLGRAVPARKKAERPRAQRRSAARRNRRSARLHELWAGRVLRQAFRLASGPRLADGGSAAGVWLLRYQADGGDRHDQADGTATAEVSHEPAERGKRGQSPFVRSTLRAVPANGDCPLFPRSPGSCVNRLVRHRFLPVESGPSTDQRCLCKPRFSAVSIRSGRRSLPSLPKIRTTWCFVVRPVWIEQWRSCRHRLCGLYRL